MAAGAVGVEVHGVRHGEGDRSWALCLSCAGDGWAG